MRVLHLATVLALVSLGGCDFGPTQDAQFSLRLAREVPAETDGFRFSAFSDSRCPEPRTRAVGGSVSGDLDNVYLPRNQSQLFPLEVGNYVFEVLAVDVPDNPDDGAAETVVAEGCAEGTIRVDMTTMIVIDLVVVETDSEVIR